MNYKGKKVALSGANGFIGSALLAALKEAGADVRTINGDIRDPNTFIYYDYSFDYMFHFAAPSSQVLFKQQPAYAIETTIKGFINAAEACKKNGIKLIYPSTGLLSQDKFNEYAMCKKICEDYAQNTGALGIRIFATYGPGEGHKRDYASVPYLFARDMVQGIRPIIFGDGEQVRDFIYIDDVIRGIMIMAEESNFPVIELGSYRQVSFNEIVNEINRQLNKKIKPIYIDKPDNYVTETEARELYSNWRPLVSVYEGMNKLLESFK